MISRACLWVVCSVLVSCGPRAGSDGDAGTTALDTSGEGVAAELTFEPCREDADCPASAPLCWFERRQQEEGEAGDMYWVEVSLCTRPCETDADCGAGGEADPRCLTLDGQRRCGRDCDHCDDVNELECVYPDINEDLCANVVYQ
jgi:hypothetical protein